MSWLTSHNCYSSWLIFFYEVILVETNRIIKGPDLEFGGFLQFIGIWILTTSNSVTNQAEYFSKNPRDILSECSICINQFVSGNRFESICSALKFTSPPTEINFMKYERWLLRGMVTCENSSQYLGFHVYMNLCLYGWINSHAQDFLFPLQASFKW